MELQFVEWLRSRLIPHPQLRLGPGDDAAILRLADSAECAVTVDLVTDGVDFELAATDPRRVGRKALAVNLSDLAAMAARPIAAVIALVLPRTDVNGLSSRELAQQLYEGLLPLAASYEVAIAGGDTNTWDGPLAISITAIGELTTAGPLRRDGGRVGDQLLVTGTLGGSILGKHLDFEPRVREAMLLNQRYRLHAGMDISDGLSLDLHRLTTESRCGAVLDASAIPISAAALELADRAGDGRTALDHALSDGEDFELLLAVPPEEARRLLADQPLDVPVTRLGELTAEAGLTIAKENGKLELLLPRGYEHLSND